MFTRPLPDAPDWDVAVDQFLGTLTYGTMKMYRGGLRRLRPHVGSALADLTPEQLEPALEQAFKELAPESRRQRISGVRSFVAYCCEQGWFEPLPPPDPGDLVAVRREYKRLKAVEYRDPDYVPKSAMERFCFDCDQPPFKGRNYCRTHLNERERLGRSQREVTAPCAMAGCELPRYRPPSGPISYCYDHHRQVGRDWQEAHPAPEPVLEVRSCALPECGEDFDWSSAYPRQIYHSEDCRRIAVIAGKKARLPTLNYDVSVTEKRCCTCKEVKPATEFFRNKRQRDGLSPRCKVDDRKAVVAVENANPRKVQCRDIAKGMRMYNMAIAAQRIVAYPGDSDVEGYDAIYDGQHGICPWCNKPGDRRTEPFRHEGTERWPASKNILLIDHDHGCCPSGGSCGACVRCLLHRGCNLEFQHTLEEEAERVARVKRMHHQLGLG